MMTWGHEQQNQPPAPPQAPPSYPPAGYGHHAQAYPQNGVAIGGFITGLASLIISIIPFGFFIVWPFGIVAITLGAVAHSKVNHGQSNAKKMAVAAWVLGTLSLVVAPVMWFAIFTGATLSSLATDECPNTPAVIAPCDVY